jgi:hypothetical protein
MHADNRPHPVPPMSGDGPPARSAAELLLSIVLHQMDARDAEARDGLVTAMLCTVYPTGRAQDQ